MGSRVGGAHIDNELLAEELRIIDRFQRLGRAGQGVRSFDCVRGSHKFKGRPVHGRGASQYQQLRITETEPQAIICEIFHKQ
jgi:hypothetical protein